mmetsp:Transcript_71214/g.104359  ORF Transcript_71214/g.104359 Transcript_71214/m.104359 type:complete len:116 (+) Transcript_71214:246-593(+)
MFDVVLKLHELHQNLPMLADSAHAAAPAEDGTFVPTAGWQVRIGDEANDAELFKGFKVTVDCDKGLCHDGDKPGSKKVRAHLDQICNMGEVYWPCESFGPPPTPCDQDKRWCGRY